MIAIAYLVTLAAFGFGAMWSDHKRHPVLADWLGVVWLAVFIFGVLVL